MQPQTKRQPGHPVLDEQAFQQLLSAAYVMQEHNARLKKTPKLAISGSFPAARPCPTEPFVVPVVPPQAAPVTAAPASSKNTCPACGSELRVGEAFCQCGNSTAAPSGALRKNWASLWEMHHSATPAEELTEPGLPHPSGSSEEIAEEDADIDLFPAELEEIVGKFSEHEALQEPPPKKPAVENAPRRLLEETALVATRPVAVARAQLAANEATAVSPWASALKARAWLESLRTEKPGRDWLLQQWEFSRGNLYIAAAALVLLAVIIQWGVQPPPQSTSQPRPLSPFEQLLVNAGLAEPPPSPDVYHGNPNTKVWVDVRTALYYCPGAELYGKSQGGKITTQLDAQRDQFQPSTRKPCD